jgi:hypothetical protein
MGVQGAGGVGVYKRATLMVVLRVCGVVVMEQVPRGSRHDMKRGAGVASDDGGGGCAAKGAWGQW